VTTPLTGDQILSLAPDPASAKAGATLATPRKWSGLAGSERAVWGECQGSGAHPYQTRVDLTDLASRCSCPSRKFPCKHALGLLLLFAARRELFAAAEPPAWVAEWLASRTARAERAERRAAPDAAGDAGQGAAPNAEAQARRAEARAARVRAGLDELARWVRDLVRVGIATAPARPAAFWEGMAARLVDAQAPGAARLVRQLGAMPTTGEGWPDRMLAQLGRLLLLTEAYPRVDELSAATRADVRARVGFAMSDAELAAEPGVADRWAVVGQVVEEDDRLRARRTWLCGGASGRRALLLDFAHGAAPFAEPVPPVGTALDAELAFHPGSFPQRASVRARLAGQVGEGGDAPTPTAGPSVGRATRHPAGPPAGDASIAAATLVYASALAADPWTERVLLVLAAVTPEPLREPQAGRWLVRDSAGDALPLSSRFRAAWPLLALSGGHPVWLSGEWDGESLLPLSAAAGGAPPVPLSEGLAT
jgi:hypothetical protein